MFQILLIFFLVFTALFSVYCKKKALHIWIVDYCLGLVKGIISSKQIDGPIHLMVMVVDHFELNGHADRLDAWVNGYPKIADQFKDADGEKPKHTFFYALDLLHEHELPALKPLQDHGYGEFELHWHHANDTSETFMKELERVMPIFHKYNFMKPIKTNTLACFSFIHGNWSLDNSRGAEFCGVDNEIQLLQKAGCYGDFTFPALFHIAQPSYINSIQYSVDNGCAKSYAKARPAQVGMTESEDEFMIFQGPLTINWLDWRHKWHPTFEDGDLHNKATHGDPKRIDAWVRQAIHVKGKPEWQFIKLFCHGAQDHKSVVGQATYDMFRYFGDQYNDGKKYILHYVTAREAYNIVKAAEDGRSGNPNEFRNYRIPHPNNRSI